MLYFPSFLIMVGRLHIHAVIDGDSEMEVVRLHYVALAYIKVTRKSIIIQFQFI